MQWQFLNQCLIFNRFQRKHIPTSDDGWILEEGSI